MSAIPSGISRVPNLLASQVSLRNITSTNLQLLRLQEQLSTQRRINRPSDDAIGASIVSLFDQSIERSGQRSRNLDHAGSTLGTIDAILGNITDSLRESQTIASSQVGIGADDETRAQQASVVDTIINSMFTEMNRDFAGLHLFAGGRTATRAVESFNGGFRYMGDQSGLFTDLGSAIDFPITLSGDSVAGSLSARVESDVDLDPQLTTNTLVRNLRGPAEALQGQLGTMNVTINDGVTDTVVQVDLSEAETMGDVLDKIESAIRTADPAALSGAYPTGVTLAGNRVSVNVGAPTHTITFQDGPVGTTATALGLDNFNYNTANFVNAIVTTDLDPALSDDVVLGDLTPAGGMVYGDIIIRNGGLQGILTTTATMTVGELREEVARLNIGVRVDINENNNTINFVNEVAGTIMSVAESVASGPATALGVRTTRATTLLSDFNHGRGVEIADGRTDPTTGLPDPNRNVDFRVTLSDGSTFDVDLTPSDIANVQTVVAAINAASGGLGGFVADVDPTTNGIRFTDTAGGANPISVTSLNGYAAEDLGLLDGNTGVGPPALLVGSDRAGVRVNSVFSTLIDLRESLTTNDSRGITFAGERLQTDLDRLSSSRALVGSRTRQVEREQVRLEDTTLLDTSLKSQLQDLDFVEGATRLSLLQTQLQAGLTVTAQNSGLSLLNFLG
ncbi:MAG: hypothetical protein H6812_07445 [Phycisphaeraceae bacterium]|nr:hypothetical protein [Phycisphaerales bacterium]MCB9843077.1 hypothetical protein [Phycisphaeraceae bacterium]